jgi:hypothetical protein
MERGHERPALIAPKWRSEIRRNGALLGSTWPTAVRKPPPFCSTKA